MARTGRFLLDTNIVIALFAREAAVQQRLAEASEVFVPSIVQAEAQNVLSFTRQPGSSRTRSMDALMRGLRAKESICIKFSRTRSGVGF